MAVHAGGEGLVGTTVIEKLATSPGPMRCGSAFIQKVTSVGEMVAVHLPPCGWLITAAAFTTYPEGMVTATSPIICVPPVTVRTTWVC
jgi:hypothetical protein